MDGWLAPLLGFLAGLLPTIPGWLLLSRQRAKADADIEKANAEAAERWQSVWENTLEMQTKEIDRLTQDRDLGRERIRDQRAQIELLHEQKTAAVSYNRVLTARLAMARGGKE